MIHLTTFLNRSFLRHYSNILVLFRPLMGLKSIHYPLEIWHFLFLSHFFVYFVPSLNDFIDSLSLALLDKIVYFLFMMLVLAVLFDVLQKPLGNSTFVFFLTTNILIYLTLLFHHIIEIGDWLTAYRLIEKAIIFLYKFIII